MGIKVKTIEIVTCDICGTECNKDDGEIHITVSSGHRDIGSSTIDGKITFTRPYGVSKGIICKSCKIEWLTRYIKELTS